MNGMGGGGGALDPSTHFSYNGSRKNNTDRVSIIDRRPISEFVHFFNQKYLEKLIVSISKIIC